MFVETHLSGLLFKMIRILNTCGQLRVGFSYETYKHYSPAEGNMQLVWFVHHENVGVCIEMLENA